MPVAPSHPTLHPAAPAHEPETHVGLREVLKRSGFILQILSALGQPMVAYTAHAADDKGHPAKSLPAHSYA